MDRQRRLVLGYLALLAGTVAFYTLAYWWGMNAVEGRPRTLLHSLHIVVETFTTVGYGEDAAWTTPAMTILVIAMQLSGVFVVFLALPLFVVPWLNRRLELRAPTATDLTDHVVVCGATPRIEHLLTELAGTGVAYAVLEPDREAARDRHEQGETVVHAGYDAAGLEAANAAEARAVVLDAGDETNAEIALAVRSFEAAPRIVGFVEDADHARYLYYAGVDRVLSPRHLLGSSLADKVTSTVTSQLGDTVEVGSDFELVELPVQQGSALVGASIAESGIRERTGASVIGAWFDGTFHPSPDPDRRIGRNTVLLAAGHADQLEALVELARTRGRSHRREHVVVAGHGEVGSTVRDRLLADGLECTVVDRKDSPEVDVVGDATEEETLREAGLDRASALILALGSDTDAIFATLVARKLSDEVEIVCRASEAESRSKLYAAGADYVLSLSTVSGRMLAGAVLDEDVMSVETGVELVRAEAPALVGRTLAEADVRSGTGCTVIAVERESEVLTDLGPEFRVEAGDALIVAGTDADVRRFNDLGDIDVAD
jgi:Trk K+ transport system NAD-binding subunit